MGAHRLLVVDPANGLTLVHITFGTAADVDFAVAAARGRIRELLAVDEREHAELPERVIDVCRSRMAGSASAERWRGARQRDQTDTGAPFSGYKQSGNGREWGALGFEEFTETKMIFGASLA